MSALYGKLDSDTRKGPATSRGHKKVEAELYYGSKDDSRRAVFAELYHEDDNFILEVSLPDGKRITYKLDELTANHHSDLWQKTGEY